MKKYSRKTLILNGDGVPLSIKHWTSAFTLVYKGKGHQIDFYSDDEIRDGHGHIYPVPAVVMLNKYIRRDYKKAPFSKNGILARDSYRCMYCTRELKSQDLTLDHVIPRSKWKGSGTPTCWTNIVAACFKCNSKKANLTCEEAFMWPIKSPIQPSYDDVFFGMHFHGKIEPEWIKWLSVFDSFKKEAEDHAQLCSREFA